MILQHVKSIEIVTFDDGYKYYWPEHCNGAFSADNLREIADELDRLNKDWDDQVRKEIG